MGGPGQPGVAVRCALGLQYINAIGVATAGYFILWQIFIIPGTLAFPWNSWFKEPEIGRGKLQITSAEILRSAGFVQGFFF